MFKFGSKNFGKRRRKKERKKEERKTHDAGSVTQNAFKYKITGFSNILFQK